MSVIPRMLLALGCLVLAAVWLLPIESVMSGPFSTHMTVHMAVVAIAAPLIAGGLAGQTSDPVRIRPELFPAIVASVVEMLVVWTWHAPALYHAAQHSPAVYAVEQGSFLATGLWVWLSALGGTPAQRAERGAVGIVALLLTFMHMTLLGALLALPTRTLYSSTAQPAELADQHFGGAIMLAVGAVSYLAGAMFLTVRLLRIAGTKRSSNAGASRAAIHVTKSS